MTLQGQNSFHTSDASMRMPKRKPARFYVGPLYLLHLCLPYVPVWLILSMSALILVSCDPASSPTSSGNDITNVATPALTSNPQAHASWQMQFEAAQKEAAKIDPTAVIQWVAAAFTVSQLTGDKALRTNFIFISPNGVRTGIGIEDTSPPRVAYVVPAVDTRDIKPSQADLQRYASLISKVNVGPRELAQETLDNDVSALDPINVSMQLDDYQKDLRVANPWVLSYVHLDESHSTRIMAAPDTGAILERDNYTLFP